MWGGGGEVPERTYTKYLVLNQEFPEDSDKNHKVLHYTHIEL